MYKLYKYIFIIILRILAYSFIKNHIIIYIKAILTILCFIPGSYILKIKNNFIHKLFWKFVQLISIKNNIIIINKKILSEYKKGCIIICNHLNAPADVLAFKLITNCHVITGSNTFANNFNYFNFFINYLYDNLKLIPYNNLDKNSGIEVKNKIIDLVNNNDKVLVFPEGRVNINTACKLHTFKKGLFYTAFENNIPILVSSIHYTDSNFGVDNSKNKKFDFIYLFKSNTKTYLELIKFIYPHNYLNFNDFYNDSYKLIDNNLKKYNKKVNI